MADPNNEKRAEGNGSLRAPIFIIRLQGPKGAYCRNSGATLN